MVIRNAWKGEVTEYDTGTVLRPYLQQRGVHELHLKRLRDEAAIQRWGRSRGSSSVNILRTYPSLSRRSLGRGPIISSSNSQGYHFSWRSRMSTSEPQSYVDRLYAILTVEERLRANTLIGDAVLRHNLDADFDANHPVLGVIAEAVFHCELFDRTAVRTQRLLEDVRDESQRITKIVRELEKFASTSVDRIKEAENNAFANIHQPRHVFEQQLMDEYKELKRGFVKETEELHKAAAKTRSEIEWDPRGRARPSGKLPPSC